MFYSYAIIRIDRKTNQTLISLIGELKDITKNINKLKTKSIKRPKHYIFTKMSVYSYAIIPIDRKTNQTIVSLVGELETSMRTTIS